jgi:cell division septation protein DedD
MAERERRRFEFGWLEVLGLVLIFAGGSAVVFFLGVFVGKGLQESRLQREERVVRLQVGAMGENRPEPARDNDLPRYNELAEGSPAAAPGVALAVKKPVDVRATPAPGGDASTNSPARAAVPAASPAMVASLPVARTSIPGTTLDELPRSPSSPPALAHVDSARSDGTWSVQVNATKEQAVADEVVGQLRSRGYNAYVVRVSLQGENWYRVRVGRFPTMEAATAVVMRLKNEERYPRAFLVNE